ncbi:hypothetical protein [Catellatospora citrea]|uniref:Secreted protein n=1 Tax=Catellatospora citrea TaxID=53366 RepID=A0A8J3KEA5_9ACTN|nr:hypothetical protein [Catellatospora citrea]RKE09487.1 hypothetical protein C8E86_4375 [Catellatospora citrea]GIF97448.1 hypothetical protein Cci01nite_25420 [Catellatospora citrea]
MDPRRIAGLLDAPGCRRRQALDAAQVDLGLLADAIGAPPGGQSPYARERDGTFTHLATARLPELVGRHLGIDCAAAVETSELPVGAGLWVWREPKLRLRDLPVTTDQIVLAGDGTHLFPVEIRSYACLDGHADPTKVAGTARELAVVVAALRQAAPVPERVSSRCLLVLPRNFGLAPVGTLLDVAPQVRRLGWSLDRLDAVDLPARLRVPELGGPALVDALAAVEARFGDGCPSCPMYTHCRQDAEQTGTVARAGGAAANLCGPVGTAVHALALAHGERTPSGEAEQAIADELARAAAAYGWATGGRSIP